MWKGVEGCLSSMADLGNENTMMTTGGCVTAMPQQGPQAGGLRPKGQNFQNPTGSGK